jgi:hypothetical protein
MIHDWEDKASLCTSALEEGKTCSLRKGGPVLAGKLPAVGAHHPTAACPQTRRTQMDHALSATRQRSSFCVSRRVCRLGSLDGCWADRISRTHKTTQHAHGQRRHKLAPTQDRRDRASNGKRRCTRRILRAGRCAPRTLSYTRQPCVIRPRGRDRRTECHLKNLESGEVRPGRHWTCLVLVRGVGIWPITRDKPRSRASDTPLYSLSH